MGRIKTKLCDQSFYVSTANYGSTALERIYDNAGIDCLEVEMGLLARRKTENGYEWLKRKNFSQRWNVQQKVGML